MRAALVERDAGANLYSPSAIELVAARIQETRIHERIFAPRAETRIEPGATLTPVNMRPLDGLTVEEDLPAAEQAKVVAAARLAIEEIAPQALDHETWQQHRAQVLEGFADQMRWYGWTAPPAVALLAQVVDALFADTPQARVTVRPQIHGTPGGREVQVDVVVTGAALSDESMVAATEIMAGTAERWQLESTADADTLRFEFVERPTTGPDAPVRRRAQLLVGVGPDEREADVGKVRAWLVEFLKNQKLPEDMIQDARRALSEWGGNALNHTDGPVLVRATVIGVPGNANVPGRVLVEVLDGSTRFPPPMPAEVKTPEQYQLDAITDEGNIGSLINAYLDIDLDADEADDADDAEGSDAAAADTQVDRKFERNRGRLVVRESMDQLGAHPLAPGEQGPYRKVVWFAIFRPGVAHTEASIGPADPDFHGTSALLAEINDIDAETRAAAVAATDAVLDAAFGELHLADGVRTDRDESGSTVYRVDLHAASELPEASLSLVASETPVVELSAQLKARRPERITALEQAIRRLTRDWVSPLDAAKAAVAAAETALAESEGPRDTALAEARAALEAATAALAQAEAPLEAVDRHLRVTATELAGRAHVSISGEPGNRVMTVWVRTALSFAGVTVSEADWAVGRADRTSAPTELEQFEADADVQNIQVGADFADLLGAPAASALLEAEPPERWVTG